MSHIKDRLNQYKDEYSKYSKHDGLYVEDVLGIIEQLQSNLEQDEKENISEYFEGETDAFEFAIKIVKGGWN